MLVSELLTYLNIRGKVRQQQGRSYLRLLILVPGRRGDTRLRNRDTPLAGNVPEYGRMSLGIVTCRIVIYRGFYGVCAGGLLSSVHIDL